MSITLHNMKNIGPRASHILDTYHANIEAPRPNGLKRFEVNGKIVFALNMKNAIRKAALYPDREIIGG